MEQIFSIVRQVTVFLLIVTALERFGGSAQYRRYIEFAAGLIVIAIVLGPLLDLFGGKHSFRGWLDSCLAGQEIKQMEQEMESFGTDYEKKVMKQYKEMITQDVAALCGVKRDSCHVRISDGCVQSIRVEMSAASAESANEKLAEEIAMRYGIGEDSVWLITSGKD